MNISPTRVIGEIFHLLNMYFFYVFKLIFVFLFVGWQKVSSLWLVWGVCKARYVQVRAYRLPVAYYVASPPMSYKAKYKPLALQLTLILFTDLGRVHCTTCKQCDLPQHTCGVRYGIKTWLMCMVCHLIWSYHFLQSGSGCGVPHLWLTGA